MVCEHWVNTEGGPDGGVATGTGFTIAWQRGPSTKNGATVEDVLLAALSRLKYYQASKFKCAENEHAIAHLENAIACLDRLKARLRSEGMLWTQGLTSAEDEA